LIKQKISVVTLYSIIRTIVFSPLRNDNKIPSFDFPLFTCYYRFADTRGEDQVLIDCVDL
jgi:hypothetical protein